MKSKYFSIPKFEENVLNEDAAGVRKDLIAVSDGAGGGGMFAECWSRHLIDHLPTQAITTAEALDRWVDEIAPEFCNKYEAVATEMGGMYPEKFFSEGAFATLVAVWRLSDGSYAWMSYGDSVAFCYNRRTRELTHSFTRLADFNRPPYLINCNDPLNPKGFRAGHFAANPDQVIFAASDTLAHYLLASYLCADVEKHEEELNDALQCKTKNSVCLQQLLQRRMSFYSVLKRLIYRSHDKTAFAKYLYDLKCQGLLGHDDYSFVAFPRKN